MSKFLRILTLVSLLLSPIAANAQRTKGDEPHRTLLIPYPTESLARERALTRQRYMQPIDEWVDVEGALRGEFTFPFSWLERQVFIRIEGVRQPYEVFVNGKRAGGTTNGYAATEFNITKLSKEDKNRVELRLMGSGEVAQIECFDHIAPHPVAYIISQPRVRVRDVAWRANIDVGVVNADFSVVMENETLGKKSSRLSYELYLNDTIRLDAGFRDVELGMYGTDTMRFGCPVPDTLLWSSERPATLSLRLRNRIESRDAEFYDFEVRLRTLEYKEGKFFVNNRECCIEWHELSPRITLSELEHIYNQGVRNIRFTAGWVSDEILSYCDTNGIYVAVTAPINTSHAGNLRTKGNNPSNDPKWREEYIKRTEEMIHTTKRHPSVIAYYLADDSANGICLYESYLKAKEITSTPIFYEDGGKEWNSDNR